MISTEEMRKVEEILPKVNLHTSEDAFNHKVDMPSKLVELNIARMQCIAVFASMQTKNASPWC